MFAINNADSDYTMHDIDDIVDKYNRKYGMIYNQ